MSDLVPVHVVVSDGNRCYQLGVSALEEGRVLESKAIESHLSGVAKGDKQIGKLAGIFVKF